MWSYEYTPYFLAALASPLIFAGLGAFVWRRRTAPGAVPFLFMVAFGVVWGIANGLLLGAATDTARSFWFKFQASLMLPMATAELCFGIEYAGLGRLVTLKYVSLLAAIPLAFILLAATNGLHHLVWHRIWFDGGVRLDRGPALWGGIGYGFFLGLLNLIVLGWLFVRSPRHRWIAAGLMIALIIVRCAALLNVLDANLFAPVNPITVVSKLSFLFYALAFVRLRMFEVVPVARDMIVERMTDALMVLDMDGRIADINGPARKLFAVDTSKIVGKRVADILKGCPDLLFLLDGPDKKQCELSLGNGHSRWYQASVSRLVDRRNFNLGRLLWLHDITEQRTDREKILDQEKTLATLRERELLARELHDGIGQMLAAVHMQVTSAGALLARGEMKNVISCLDSIAMATRKSKEFIRNYLLGIKAGVSSEPGLLAALYRYIDHYSRDFRIHVGMTAPPDLEDRLDSDAKVQLQPIVQEALTNIRKHSGAASAHVTFALSGDEIHITVADDGRGFEPSDIEGREGFGFRSMRGRAEAIGARLEVDAAAGKGTRLIIRVPCRKERQ